MLIVSGTPLYPYFQEENVQEEEKEDYYAKWLNEDVVYIITPQEKDVFEKLTTPEEKDRFIEQFWSRRDPIDSTRDDFKIEHYLRIAYANENFKSGIDGWASDRGRIYITFGPPDGIDRYPGGHIYSRPLKEGGGTTTTYPFEVWHYRYLPGIASGIEIEFVDSSRTGEYKLALRPEEKDALLRVPAGETLFELAGLENRAGRIRSMNMMRSAGVEGDSVADPGANPFLRLERYFSLRRTPTIKFEDLHALVDSRIVYQQIPIRFHIGELRVSSGRVLIPLTIGIPKSKLTFASVQGSYYAKIHLYGRLETLTHRTAYEFEDDLTYSSAEQPGSVEDLIVYQKKIPLEVGRYKLVLIVKDFHSGKIGTVVTSLHVSRQRQHQELQLSSIFFPEKVQVADRDDSLIDPFVVTAGYKIYPKFDPLFKQKDPLLFYFEIYNLASDMASGRPDLKVEYAIISPHDDGLKPSYEDISQRSVALWGNHATVFHKVNLVDVNVGDHVLRLRVTDRIEQRSVPKDLQFRIVP